MFISTQTIKNQIEFSLQAFDTCDANGCLELIMSLHPEDRIVYLNQYVQRVAEFTNAAGQAWLKVA